MRGLQTPQMQHVKPAVRAPRIQGLDIDSSPACRLQRGAHLDLESAEGEAVGLGGRDAHFHRGVFANTLL